MMLWAIISRLKTTNFFGLPLTANDEYELQNERISTRIFVVMLIVSILIIFTYTAQVNITQTIEVKYPSYELFQSLSIRYPQTLRCPCNNVAISHGSFIFLQPEFHQLCSSDFITANWINHLASAASELVEMDFTYMGSLFFLTLSSFCRSANETVLNALQTFTTTKYISSYALMENTFEEQINATITDFLSSTELSYYQSFDLIHFSTRTNVLLSSLFSNMDYLINIFTYGFFMAPQEYSIGNSTCDCETAVWCASPMSLQDHRAIQNSSVIEVTIPGLYMGCYLVQSVRQSTLECFYQASCIEMIEELLQAPLALNKPILPLNSSIESRFNASTFIDELLFRLMTEEWQRNISHIQYYLQCEVSSCIYSFTSKFNIVYIITTLVGLIGGLTKVYRIVIPRVVKIIRRRLIPPPTVANESELVRRSLLERLRNFNYFANPISAPNEVELKQQLIATRLFFLLLTVSFIILISYYGSQHNTTIHEVESPTYEQFLGLVAEQQSNPSFSCPCSTLSISYSKFIGINGTLHPLCYSDFVQPEWYYIFDINVVLGLYYTYDFRMFKRLFFYSLLSFCQTSSDHISTSITSFNSSSFVVDKALTTEIFTAETNTIINVFKLSTIRSFIRTLAFISNITQSNGLMSGKFTNFYFDHFGVYPLFTVHYFSTGYLSSDFSILCLCHASTQCFIPMSIYLLNTSDYSVTKLFDFPGLFQGCLMMESIRHSNLACLFDQSCVDLMAFWINQTTVKAIDSNSLHNFDVNSTVDDMINGMFVDQWNISVSHRDFYQQCQPDHCTYTIVQRNSFWLILTTVFGLIGGLIKILQVTVPRLVQGIYALHSRCHRREGRAMTIMPATQSNFSFQFIIKRLRQLNIFPSENPTTDTEYEINGQILATRVFIILLILSLVILTTYSSQVQITKTVTIANPSIEQYFSVYKSYSQTLTCPCEEISILQHTFLTFQPIFHQVCESNFVDPQWSTSIYLSALGIDIYKRDFRRVGEYFFETIRSLCQLSYTTLNDALTDFNQTIFVSPQMIAEDQFFQQTNILFDVFITTNINAFVVLLQNIQDTTYTNVLMSALETSSTIQFRQFEVGFNIHIDRIPEIYNFTSSCSCYNDPKCIEPAALYTTGPNYTIIHFIPGFFIGCYIVEATLQSNLAVLYNQSLVDDFRLHLQSYYFNPIPFNATALNASLDSRYNMTTPISDMMQNLMTESWIRYANYSAYYDQCHPIECKYTYIMKYDVIYIITTIIGLIGGLVTVFQFVIPPVVKFIRRCWFNRHHQTTTPVIPITSIS